MWTGRATHISLVVRMPPLGSNFSKRYFRHSHQAAKNTSRTNTTSGTSTGPGVSTLDIQAATNGGLTPANKPTANNTLGLDIE
jgi:hypothetical protein